MVLAMNGIDAMVKQLNDAQSLMPKSSICLKTMASDIIRDYKKDTPINVLVQRYGVSKTSVYKLLKARGVYEKRAKAFDRSLKLIVVHERFSGKKTGYLAEKYGISASTVSKWVNQYKEGKL